MKKSQVSFEFISIFLTLLLIFVLTAILFTGHFLQISENKRRAEIDNFVNILNNEIVFIESAYEGYKNEIVLEDLVRGVEVVNFTQNYLVLYDTFSNTNYSYNLKENYFPKLEEKPQETKFTFYKKDRLQNYIDMVFSKK